MRRCARHRALAARRRSAVLALYVARAAPRQRLPLPRPRAGGRLLHRDRRAEPPHRLHGPDLARPRRADGGRRLHDRGAGRARALARRLDDPARRARRRRRRLPDRPPALRLSGLYLALATFAFAVAMPSLLKKFSGLTGGGQGLRLLEQAPLQVTGPQRHGHDLRPHDDAEPLPLLPDVGDRPGRLRDRVADRARPARPHLPRRARQRGRRRLGRDRPRRARRRSPSRSAASTPASRARCSRSRPRS